LLISGHQGEDPTLFTRVERGVPPERTGEIHMADHENPFWTLRVERDDGEVFTQSIYPDDAERAIQEVGRTSMVFSNEAGYKLIPAHRIKHTTCYMP
jgi:hypothetical protein